MRRLKKNIFLFCMYKMVEISKKLWQKNGVEIIIFNGKKWLNEKHVEEQLDHANLPAVTNQYFPELKNKDKKYKITTIISLVEDF